MIEEKLIFNFQFANIRCSEEAPLLEDLIKSFSKYNILDRVSKLKLEL